jgi:hypothetical protein
MTYIIIGEYVYKRIGEESDEEQLAEPSDLASERLDEEDEEPLPSRGDFLESYPSDLVKRLPLDRTSCVPVNSNPKRCPLLSERISSQDMRYELIADCAKCRDCGDPVHDFYVSQKIWDEVIGSEGVWCWDCFADRAHRKGVELLIPVVLTYDEVGKLVEVLPHVFGG